MNLLIKRISFSDKEFDLVLAIRKSVFVEEQGVNADLEFDGKDPEANHYLLYLDTKPIATARWRITLNGIKLERFAVLPDYRNKKIGAELLNRIMNDALTMNLPIYLHAQQGAANFYSRNGFSTVGNIFFEAGIAHVKMEFKKEPSKS